MGTSSLFFWILVWILLELFWVRNSAQVLALGICWAIIIVELLLNLEFDLIGLLLLSSAAAAFISLSLCLLHLGMNDTISKGIVTYNMQYFILLLILFSSAIVNNSTAPIINSLITYVDTQQALSARSLSSLLVLHEFFYSLFIIETLLLNIYLTAGLVLIVILLFNNRKINSFIKNKVVIHRLRGAARLRRQSRRKDGSIQI